MASLDGNGWVRCGQGHRHWGKHGAAGLLVYTGGTDGEASVLLQLRSPWGHHGGTWGIPGGAMDSHESAEEAALREAAEECGVEPDAVTITGITSDDHVSWAYWTVVGATPDRLPAYPASAETDEVAWVGESDVERMSLHPGFAAQWPRLRQALQPFTIIVDAANVMGSRPDGWWRDRAGAAARLRDQLSGLAGRGLTGLPDSVPLPGFDRWYPGFVLVVEGAAKVIVNRTDEPEGRFEVTAAPGSGDDKIAALAGGLPGRRLVVTADRELRRRCTSAGAAVAGPGWLLGLL
ncbi:MAG TPA: NUDIX domain-containing protein [Streptosporangiaceae bacterium]|jgi:8-oxo-dGTP pyrophosphatase MutT (NUDIX family)